MIFLKTDVDLLNKMYRIVEMGIIGVEEVVKRVEDSCLEKLMLDQKKDYMVIKKDIRDLLDLYEEDPKKISTMQRVSNDIYTNMKLKGNEDDKVISKMMFEGTNKGVIEVTSILHDRNYENDKIGEIAEHLLKVLEYNGRELKKYL